MTAPTWADVTVESLRRALYIDFEGQKDKPPVLLGCARRTGKAGNLPVWQYVTDPAFAPLARAGGMELLELPAAIERILQRAEKKDRQIVAWSEHELDVVKAWCPEHLARFESRYVNARSYAVRWRNKCHGGGKPETATLAAYLDLIGHAVPGAAGPGHVGMTISRARTSLEKGMGVAGLTDDQRRRWELLREHNRHDCIGMRKVCLRAADEIVEAIDPVLQQVADAVCPVGDEPQGEGRLDVLRQDEDPDAHPVLGADRRSRQARPRDHAAGRVELRGRVHAARRTASRPCPRTCLTGSSPT